MSTPDLKPIPPTTSPTKSIPLDEGNGIYERGRRIADREREFRAANGDSQETTVSVKIPRSMQTKVRTLSDFLDLSAKNLLNSSLKCVISYAKIKKIEIQQMDGYPKDKLSGTNNFTQTVELSRNVFDELNQQNLLSDVSECAVLGLELLYQGYQGVLGQIDCKN